MQVEALYRLLKSSVSERTIWWFKKISFWESEFRKWASRKIQVNPRF